MASFAPWASDLKSVQAHLGTKTLKAGLSSDQVEANRARFGSNVIPPGKGTSLLALILEQFKDTLVLILLGAAVISFILALFEEGQDRLTAFVEPAVILIILGANATVGVIQETNAEKAIEKLKESEASEAVVIRDGKTSSVHPSDLVPGDVIVVADGDKVPADARVFQLISAVLSVDEASLTGEAEAVMKSVEPVKRADVPVQKKVNMVFSGTLVVRGKALAIVTATGSQTELGIIASSLGDKEGDDEDDEASKTPLQKKLDRFGEQLSKVITVLCIIVWLINIGHFTDPVHGSVFRGAIYYFKIAVALAVAAIPEGLPAVVTTCLALGTFKMAKNGAIVRSLPSVETLGCTTVICSDKTGTITTNKMSVQRVVIDTASDAAAAEAGKPKPKTKKAASKPTTTSRKRGAAAAAVDGATETEIHEYSVTGDSWSPLGEVVEAADDDVEIVYPGVDVPALTTMSKIATLCNESTLTYATDAETGAAVYGKTGAPTEAALLVLAEKIGVPDEAAMAARDSLPAAARTTLASEYWAQRFSRVTLLEFDRNRKSMSMLVQDVATKKQSLLVKGAAEKVLERCDRVLVDETIQPLSRSLRSALEARLDELNDDGLRSLALAFREDAPAGADYTDVDRYEEYESGLVFVGLAGMLDPPRAPVKAALAQCKQAGIRVMVITGDNVRTAESISRRIGLFADNEDTHGKSFTGDDLNQMSPADLAEAVKTAKLFARVEPRHKLAIVEALKKQGEVVAMTGDGVNDAPALNRADIGVAMGSGTSVAKESSKMILQDDNFATIVMAVEEGRAIYANTKQFIRYLVSSNIGEVACIFGTAALGIPDALIPVQLLWVNLVTDGLPATALGFNPADPDVMKSKPRDADENIINSWMFFRYLTIGIYVGIATIGGFVWWYLFANSGPHITFWQLTHFHECKTNPLAFAGVDCSIFTHPLPSTISLSILVLIEMFNAFNALSENQSLLTVTPMSNPWVMGAAVLSVSLHLLIVYVPFFNAIFKIAPLGKEEWLAVAVASLPVFLVDETLKLITRVWGPGKISVTHEEKTK
jgi:Ca2+ transporting ATPase